MASYVWQGTTYGTVQFSSDTTVTGYGGAMELDVFNATTTLDGAFAIDAVYNQAGLDLFGDSTIGTLENLGTLEISGTLSAIGDIANTYHGILQYEGSSQILPGATLITSEYLILYYPSDVNIAGTVEIDTPTTFDNFGDVVGGFDVESNSFVYVQSGGSLLTTYLSVEAAYAIVDVDEASVTVTQTTDMPGGTAGIQLAAGTLVVENGSTLDTTAISEVGVNQTSPSTSLFLVDAATVTISAPAADANGLVVSDGEVVFQGGSEVTASQVILQAPTASDPSVPALTVAGSTLSVSGPMALADGSTLIDNFGTVTVAAGLVLDSPATQAGFYQTTLSVGSFGTLDVLGNVLFGASALAGVVLDVTEGGQVEIGGNTLDTAPNTLAIDSGAILLGHGLITSDQSGTTYVGNFAQPNYALSVIDDGTIDVNQGTMIIDGNITGPGSILLEAGATLELGGSVSPSTSIDFTGTGQHTLILDNPAVMNGTITGLALGDQIILRNASIANADGLVSATLGTFDTGPQRLEVRETPDYVNYVPASLAIQPDFIPVVGSFVGDFVNVTQSTSGVDTVLTLAQGNPIDLSIGGAAAQVSFPAITGAGIKIGVISDSFNFLGGESYDQSIGALGTNVFIANDGTGADEGRAMAEIIHDIAPNAAIDFYSDASITVSGFVAAVDALITQGCNIIVDDLGFGANEFPANNPADQAVDQAVADGITYVTAAGNDRQPPTGPLPIYGHSADPNALTVAAMNVLATPSTVGGYITTPMTEDFSSIGTVAGKPDLTGPDGGATTLPLLMTNPQGTLVYGLSPFFGTSAAAPAVAAVAALMMQQTPSLETQPLEVDQLLEASAIPFGEPADEMGAGLVNIEAALQAASAVCYARGTRVLTGRGEVAVEDLVIGDRLITLRGEGRALRWIGRRAYAGASCVGNADVLPIRIRAHAIAAGVPKRDLYISPKHALYFGGVLIPARALTNEATIVQVHDVQHVEYFHLELSSHDVIYAEGALAESYIDFDNRAMFSNVAEYCERYPDAAPAPRQDYAPRAEDGLHVDAVWSRLAARADLLGHRRPRAHRIEIARTGVFEVLVPPGVTELRLVCKAGRVPGDLRALGALVSGVTCDGQVIDLADRRLARGFYPVERHGAHGVRWTNGEAVLILAHPPGARCVQIDIAQLMCSHAA